MSPLFDAVADAIRHSGSALAGSLVVALACALLGVHVVARRLIVVGIALPQMAALGIAVSFLLAGAHAEEVNHLRHDAMALVFELAGVAVLVAGGRGRSLGHDTLAGALFVGGSALTILLMTRSAQGLEEIRHLVEGDVLFVGRDDLVRLCVMLGPVVLVHALGGRRLTFCTFDRETAATLGIRTGRWELAFYATLAVTVAAGVHATGTLFVFAYLVLPGASGIALARSTAGVFATAVTVALVASFTGFVLSYACDWPTGQTCAAAALAAFVVCAAAAAVRDRFAAAPAPVTSSTRAA
jgi:zinc/manganese transport system permease protein